MIIDTFRRLSVFIALLLVQVLVLNHVFLFGWATILLYVYFVVMFPRNYPRWAILLWSFAMGLSVDMFANTPGMAAASLTIVGFIQPYLLELFIPREAPENLRTAAATLGLSKFTIFASMLVFVHCLLFFSIETFTSFHWQHWLLSIGGSTFLTLALLIAVELVRK